MATYAGVTFDVVYESADYADYMPEFEDEQRVVENAILGGNGNDIQFLGCVNARLRVRALVASVADLATLKAARGATLRTLNYRAANVLNVLLLQVGRRQYHENGKVSCDLEFMQGTAAGS